MTKKGDKALPAVIWTELMKDRLFATFPEWQCEVFKPFVEAMPVALADLLDEPMTLQSFAKAKLAFLRYCLDNHLSQKIDEADPDNKPAESAEPEKPAETGFGAVIGVLVEVVETGLGAMLELGMENLAEGFQELVDKAPAMLEKAGVTEEQVMLSPDVGLNEKAMALYKKGNLTIRKVLQIQPMIIFKFTN